EDHLPIKVVIEDGASERHISYYERDPQTGRITTEIVYSTDFDSGVDEWTELHDFTYTPKGGLPLKL
ncbi:MAG: hypothetical protein AAGJ35_15235, partial [Myxococcota bacterium]